MVTLKKFCVFLKTHWYLPLIALGALVAYLMKDKELVDWEKVLQRSRDSHKEEVRVIEEAHAKAEARKAIERHRVAEALKQVEEEYLRNERELTAQKKKRVEKIAKKLRDDPLAMAKEIEQETGYRVIVID